MCRVLFDPRTHAPTYLPCEGSRDKSTTTATAPDSFNSRTEGDCVSGVVHHLIPCRPQLRDQRSRLFRSPMKQSHRGMSFRVSSFHFSPLVCAILEVPVSIIHMKIHEYQAKALLARYGVPVPRGEVAHTVAEAEAAAHKLGGTVVVKAQIHAGGRGKGGGVKVVKNSDEARAAAEKILGMTLVTHQTGPEGSIVQRLLIEEGLPIERELYLGIVLDRATGKNTFMASADGGVEIEEVAAKTPERILKETIEPGIGLQPFQARKLAFGIGIPGPMANAAAKAMMALARASRIARRLASRNQPLHPDQRRQSLRARRQGHASTTTPSSATRISSNSATSTKKIPLK